MFHFCITDEEISVNTLARSLQVMFTCAKSLFSAISSREELCKWGHCLRQLMSSPSLLAFGKKCLLMLTNVAKKALHLYAKVEKQITPSREEI